MNNQMELDNVQTLVTSKVIQKLKSEHFYISGDDTALENTWEEFCAQVQREHSLYWETYLQHVQMYVTSSFHALDRRQKVTLNEETDSFMFEVEAGGVVPIFEDEIIEMLMNDLMKEAADYESSSLSAFFYGEEYDDEDDE
ncbi:hypothetical protein, partial [Vibrio breoganii]|uniref:hypothetical protein n=1 Tax=Vibrio breoganii TaxID=553239 RepID=UPI0018E4757B